MHRCSAHLQARAAVLHRVLAWRAALVFPTSLRRLLDELLHWFVGKVGAADEPGVYTVVNGFHQLAVPEARDLVRSVAESRRVILVLEGNNDNGWQAAGMLVFAPLSALLTAPFVKPFRLSRLVFTYLIPLMPIIIAIDGMAALFRLCAPRDLDELFASLDIEGYVWQSGKRDNGRGGKIIYAIGYPGDARAAGNGRPERNRRALGHPRATRS